ncbi:hypothetical protein GGR32_000189 [Mesonia hippocampi]|uniref:Uncharacterized protein n=1 Tax=Mesonia hippocampi TaxID=1628250 RepID=A0A840ESK2_9FLAO|nr:hypothetical protein [Mesonia hippocampi]
MNPAYEITSSISEKIGEVNANLLGNPLFLHHLFGYHLLR